MFRGPIVITSLEEDFKKIGILVEKDESKAPVEPSDKEKVKAEGSAKAETAATDDSDEEYIEGQENMTDEELEEARIRRRTVKGKRSMKATKRTPPRLKMKAKRNYRKKKMKIKLARRKKMRKPMVRRRMKFLAKRRSKMNQGHDTISNLIEEVQDIVSSLNGGQQDAIKSFANIAIIADMLANTFTEWTNDIVESEEEIEEGDDTLEIFKTSAESLADLAEAAAEVASALKAGQDIDGDEKLEDIFRDYMADMLEGMDIYNEAVQLAKDEDDDEEGEETVEGEMPDFIKKKVAAKKDDDEDEDDEDEDDAEESVKGDKESSLKKKK